MGGPWVSSLVKQKKIDAKTPSVYSVRMEWVDFLGRNMYVRMYMYIRIRPFWCECEYQPPIIACLYIYIRTIHIHTYIRMYVCIVRMYIRIYMLRWEADRHGHVICSAALTQQYPLTPKWPNTHTHTQQHTHTHLNFNALLLFLGPVYDQKTERERERERERETHTQGRGGEEEG